MVRRAAGLALKVIAAILVIAPLSAWSALALWFRLPAPEVLRASAAILFCVLGLVTIAALFMRLSRSLVALAVFAVAICGLLTWWSTIKPPLDGDWAPDVARQTTGAVKGDILTLSDVRDFDWRTDKDYTERWDKRSYDLSKLKTLDLFLAYWAGPEMAHVIMSFGFEDGEHIAWSVEVRREKTGVFSPVADAFKNHTLVYLATAERDSVRLRTNVRGEDVRLYRLNTPPAQARALLLEYVSEFDRARQAAEVLQFHHRQLRDRSLQDRSRRWRDLPPGLASRRQRLSARLSLRPEGRGHHDAAQRAHGARAHQRPGQGRGSVARLFAAHSRRRAIALGQGAAIGPTYRRAFFVAVRCASSADGSARSPALGAAYAIAPRSSTIAWSVKGKIFLGFCSTTIIDKPARPSSRKAASNSSTMIGAKPSVGSSSRKRRGLTDQRAADGQHLLLAARQLPAHYAAPLPKAWKERVDPFDRPGSGNRDRGQVLLDGQRAEDVALLRRPANAAPSAPVRRERRDVLARERDSTAKARGDADQRIDNRRLADAVAPQQR